MSDTSKAYHNREQKANNWSRRSFLASAAPLAAGSGGSMRRKSNLILICANHLRHDVIHGLGRDHVDTPNLDRFVREGAAFVNAFTTTPAPEAARDSLVTGMWPSQLARQGRKPVLITNLLRGAGYRVAWVGPGPAVLRPDDCDVFLTDPPREVLAEPAPALATSAADHAVTTAGLQFLVDTLGKPFCLFVSYWAPGPPWVAPEEHLARYRGRPWPASPGESRAAKRQQPDGVHAAPAGIRETYRARVSLFDHEISRIFSFLELEGLDDSTLTLVTSPTGDYAGEFGLAGAGEEFDDCLIRVPLLVRAPGNIESKLRPERPVSLAAIAPTLAAAAGLNFAATEQPLLLTGRKLAPAAGYSIAEAAGGGRRMIRTAKWKLSTPPMRLFDLERDPSEEENLAEDAAHRPVVDKLRAALAAWPHTGGLELP